MAEQEFNLSEKRIIFDEAHTLQEPIITYLEKDIKEFIKRLKDVEIDITWLVNQIVQGRISRKKFDKRLSEKTNKEIDKLAGSKLS